ncbi:MAG TPA: M28 family peptidase [Phycisphaerae bacterium]|nr:M28 family peptidase [Phycisphaerae bacterium]HPU34710.1 M28 family peptidase [Phycisphaerae bacterium]HXK86875.1 M28 family peptidase [Phycisphaerae bacterium]
MHRLPRRIGIWVVLTCLLVSGCAPQFNSSRFIEHIAVLASDDMDGRGLGTPGIERAAEYIAHQFEQAGLRPAGEEGTWFQKFEVTLGQEIGREPVLAVSGAPGQAVPGKDFVPFPFSTAKKFEGPLAFVGYGITHDDEQYDDYAGFDGEGKVLLMFRFEPHAKDPKAKFGGKNPSRHATFSTKAWLARTRGAAAILVVNPPLHHGERDTLFAFDSIDHVKPFGIPMMHVSREYANRLLKAAGAEDLVTFQKALDARKQRTMDLKGLVARGDPGLVKRTVTTRNVLAVLPGSGPDADEHIVIGAHYDHIGRTTPRKRAGAGPVVPEVHNGADDNASGTAGILELARIFALRGAPNRSLLFIAFSGEESGLLGSAHYVENPTVPLEQTVAMINLDMIGRLRYNRLEAFGTNTGTSFQRLVTHHARLMGFHLKASGGGFGPSDHTSFYRNEIPVLHFFTGIHKDYHMPSDDTETINAEGGARVVHLVYNVAHALANAPARPRYVAVAEKPTPRTGLKVRLGVMPSYAEDDQPGLLIDGVSADSPAEQAGLQEGDRILSIGNVEVNDVYGLMEAMNHYNPGDEAKILILRNGKRVEVGVTFEAAKKG